MSNTAKGARFPKKTIYIRVWSCLGRSGEPVSTEVLRGLFGKHVQSALRRLEVDGKIKKRRTFTQGHPLEYTLADREWPARERTIEQDNQEKRDRDKAYRQAKHGIKSKTTAQQTAARQEQMEQDMLVEYPFFSEKFVPYIGFFPPKIARKYERTLEIRQRRELAAANQQRFGNADERAS